VLKEGDEARKQTGWAAPASMLALPENRTHAPGVFARRVQGAGLAVIVIRRLVDRHRAYTGIFLPGEPPRIFPTTDFEHGRILQIYKQDRLHEGIINDFSELALGQDRLTAASVTRPTLDQVPSPGSG
jgi:hypothetical protein